MNDKNILLPFNFSRYNGIQLDLNALTIRKHSSWLYFVLVPYGQAGNQVLDDILKDHDALLIDGCDITLAEHLKSSGFESIKIGREAVLETYADHFSKKSLKELIRRGSKKGKITEVIYSEISSNKLNSFIYECAHGTEPQLKYLFNDKFMNHNRLFVLETAEGNWQAAILISETEQKYAKTDLILRRKNASVGVMEFLIYSIFTLLKKGNYKYWSLGAVPFIVYNNNLFTKEGIINYFGRRLKFAYNYKGLFNFKNKFNPFWKDYFFCFKPRLTIKLLVNILQKTNLLKLVRYKLFKLNQT